MSNKQKRLQEVYAHLRRWYGIHTQTDFANSMRYSRNAISLALNGNEKYLTDSLFRNICEAYPGVFDLNYLLTGEGQLLTIEEEVKSEDIEKTSIIDLYATLIKEVEGLRMMLKEELNEVRDIKKSLVEDHQMLNNVIDRILDSPNYGIMAAENH